MNRSQSLFLACAFMGVCELGCEITFNLDMPETDLSQLRESARPSVEDASTDASRQPNEPTHANEDSGVRTEGTEDASPAIDARTNADARTSATDAASSQSDAIPTDSPDVYIRRDPHDFADAPTGEEADRLETVHAEVISASQCHGRNMAATNTFVGYARDGLSVWHLCYRTPSTDTSSLPPDQRPRSSRVLFYWYNTILRAYQEVGAVDAPRTANPWTANLLIALPHGRPATFNAGNIRTGMAADYLYAVQENVLPNGALELNGQMQVWRVNADGTQTVAAPALLCRDPASRNNAVASRSFFRPNLDCTAPVSLASCAPVEHDCRLAEP
ncbi:MAG: hypothetical protein WCV84_05375 [Patescibacteria group bacterium]